MKTLVQISVTTVFFALLFYSAAVAQGGTPVTSGPGGNPLQTYNYAPPGYLLQTGGFVSTSGGGLDLVYRPGSRPLYGRLYLGGLMNPEKRIDHALNISFGGISLGYEKVLNSGSGLYADSGVISGVRDDTQFYFRIGSGVNFTRVNRLNLTTGEQSDKLHPGMHTDMLFGASTRMTQSTSFYFEIGGRVAWNYDLPEMRWLAGPHLAFGIHLFGSRGLPVRGY